MKFDLVRSSRILFFDLNTHFNDTSNTGTMSQVTINGVSSNQGAFDGSSSSTQTLRFCAHGDNTLVFSDSGSFNPSTSYSTAAMANGTELLASTPSSTNPITFSILSIQCNPNGCLGRSCNHWVGGFAPPSRGSAYQCSNLVSLFQCDCTNCCDEETAYGTACVDQDEGMSLLYSSMKLFLSMLKHTQVRVVMWMETCALFIRSILITVDTPSNFDTSTFSASELCCVCGGGETADWAIVPSESECENIDNATNQQGRDCSFYSSHPYLCEVEASLLDNDDFNATRDCCACGGGGNPTGGPENKWFEKTEFLIGAGVGVVIVVLVIFVVCYCSCRSRQKRDSATLEKSMELGGYDA